MTAAQHWHPKGRSSDRTARAADRRQRWVSIAALALAFVVWTLWSAVVVHLPAAGFRYSTNQLFWLTALPALSGATLRLFGAFLVPLIGGRRFTTLATAGLLLPAVGIGLAVQDPGTPFEWMVVLALLCGLGGGNFASLNRALSAGRSAGLIHLGVALAQLLVPLVIGAGMFGAFTGPAQPTPQGPMWLQNAGFIWVPLILASTAAAWLCMDDLADTPAAITAQVAIFTNKHSWQMGWLCLGSLGSFIGFAASLPLLVQSQFPRAEALHMVWLGPLLGAAMGPLGARMASRWDAARVTFWTFVAMALGATAALLCLPARTEGGSFPGFVAAFGLLFAAAGIANGGSFQMISRLFVTERMHCAEGLPSAQVAAAREGATQAVAALGFASAIGAYGGFFIPKSLGSSLEMTGTAAPALAMFVLFYLTCIALTWWAYSRRNAPFPC